MKIIELEHCTAGRAQAFRFDASFGPYIRFLKQKMESVADIRAKIYEYIIQKFEDQPQLLNPFTDLTSLKEQDDLIRLLKMSIAPLTEDAEDIPFAFASLEPIKLFYYSDSFKKLLLNKKGELAGLPAGSSTTKGRRHFICLVLDRFYQQKTGNFRMMVQEVYDRENNFTKYYRVMVDHRFMDVIANGELPPFREEWLELPNLSDEEIQLNEAEFPYDSFRLEGFNILFIEDISAQEAVHKLKSSILDMHNDGTEATIRKVEDTLKSILEQPDLQVGITPFFKLNNKFVHDPGFCTRCLVIGDSGNQPAYEELAKKFTDHPKPYIFSVIDDKLVEQKPIIKGLYKRRIKSFVAWPVFSKDGLLGVIELGSSIPGTLNANTLNKLEPVFPVITELFYFMTASFNENIERLVKEKFTSLQSSVVWKFNEVAWDYLRNGNETYAANIVFEQVNPLFGAVDVRNSSLERNYAVTKDLNLYLSSTLGILHNTYRDLAIPLVEGMIYKCRRFIEKSAGGLTTQDEIRIADFLKLEIEPYFKHLSTQSSLSEAIKAYLSETDIATGKFHHHRREYENSLRKINNAVIKFIEAETNKLQKVYPFYFEKYRTDGVEYNIYIGQSIQPYKPFDAMYLKNLRLWQINSMVRLAFLNYKILPELSIPLQTTQLILVHTHPIDISFRRDERRFDVEGSYNIRYEIIKKRIDKVHLKETGERLTQPDTIAIVYFNDREVEEYRQHIEFLQAKGVLNRPVEILELEELQGISGLKAMRVSINYLQLEALEQENATIAAS